MEDKTAFQNWIKTRVKAVEENISTFEILSSNGYELIDEYTAMQVSCFMHGADNRPSARYYPGNPGHFYCFKCHVRLGPVDLYSKFSGLKFMDALAELEKKFGIKIDKQNFSVNIENNIDRNYLYESDSWADVKRQLVSLESKLKRVKPKCTMYEYIGMCRLLDSVYWDRERSSKDEPEMVSALIKVREKMNEIFSRQEFEI